MRTEGVGNVGEIYRTRLQPVDYSESLPDRHMAVMRDMTKGVYHKSIDAFEQ